MTTLNKEHILAVAAAIEQRSVPGLGFDMSSWATNDVDKGTVEEVCNTTACMAGFSYIIADRCQSALGLVKAAHRGGVAESARIDMGLTDDQAENLFYRTSASDKQVVATLRNLVETGYIDWDLV